MSKESKYTVYGKKIDTLIDGHLERINEGVLSIVGEADLEAVILCGGYGRGEGGVFIGADGTENLYNDYDMMVLIKPVSGEKKAQYKRELTEFGEHMGEDIGIDVDFGPLKTVSQIKNSEFTLFNYEFKYGHMVTYGPQDILDNIPEFDGNQIPIIEATKLLLNRAVGLLLSKEKLKAGKLSETDNEFVTRNIYKAIMASGDAVLMCEGTYDYSYSKRLELMKAIKGSSLVRQLDIYELYCDSMKYKFVPEKNIYDEKQLSELLEKASDQLMEMFYKTAAKAHNADSNNTYRIFSRGMFNECCLKSLVKNVLLNFKTFKSKAFNINWLMKYPRYRLFYSLPFLMGCESKPSKAEVLNALGISSDYDIHKRFITLWERFG
ncbi:MAG: hypothetical protein ACIAQZ_05525 [Sedimentisphaeraceae bacterium JB056]